MEKKDIFLNILSGLVIGTLATASFSRSSRNDIWKRSRGLSELSGFSELPKECCHFNHSRNYPLYDDTSNGLLTTVLEHYVFHRMFTGREREIGLNKHDNEFAIRETLGRFYDWMRTQRVSWTPVFMDKECEHIERRWNNYFAQKLHAKEG